MNDERAVRPDEEIDPYLTPAEITNLWNFAFSLRLRKDDVVDSLRTAINVLSRPSLRKSQLAAAMAQLRELRAKGIAIEPMRDYRAAMTVGQLIAELQRHPADAIVQGLENAESRNEESRMI